MITLYHFFCLFNNSFQKNFDIRLYLMQFSMYNLQSMNSENKIVEDNLLIQDSIKSWMIWTTFDFFILDLEMSAFLWPLSACAIIDCYVRSAFASLTTAAIQKLRSINLLAFAYANATCWLRFVLSTEFSLERRWSSHTFRYGYLVTTSPQSPTLP